MALNVSILARYWFTHTKKIEKVNFNFYKDCFKTVVWWIQIIISMIAIFEFKKKNGLSIACFPLNQYSELYIKTV